MVALDRSGLAGYWLGHWGFHCLDDGHWEYVGYSQWRKLQAMGQSTVLGIVVGEVSREYLMIVVVVFVVAAAAAVVVSVFVVMKREFQRQRFVVVSDLSER